MNLQRADNQKFLTQISRYKTNVEHGSFVCLPQPKKFGGATGKVDVDLEFNTMRDIRGQPVRQRAPTDLSITFTAFFFFWY